MCSSVSGGSKLSTDEMLDGLEHPFAAGWKLWLEALPKLATHAAVPACLAAMVIAPLLDRALEPESTSLGWGLLVPGVIAAFIGAMIAAIVSCTYATGDAENAPRLAIRRFAPWFATLILVTALTFTGYLLLVLPGIYIALRLFWADELALVHGRNPLASIIDSWRLTKGAVSEVFGFQIKLGFVHLAVWFPAMILIIVATVFIDESGLDPTIRSSLQLGVFAALATLAYGFSHACEIVFFYGLRADYQLFLTEQTDETDQGEPPSDVPPMMVRPSADTDPPQPLRCPHCATRYNPDDYRPDAVSKRCSACHGEIDPPNVASILHG